MAEFVGSLEQLGAVTAWVGRVLETDPPAAKVLTEDEREVIGIIVRGDRLLPPAGCDRPFPPDIRSWLVLLARNAGWQPRGGSSIARAFGRCFFRGLPVSLLLCRRSRWRRRRRTAWHRPLTTLLNVVFLRSRLGH